MVVQSQTFRITTVCLSSSSHVFIRLPNISDMTWDRYVTPFSYGLWLAVAIASCALGVCLALQNYCHSRNHSLAVSATFFYIQARFCQQGQNDKSYCFTFIFYIIFCCFITQFNFSLQFCLNLVSHFSYFPLSCILEQGLLTIFHSQLIWLTHFLYFYLNFAWSQRHTVSLVMVSAAVTVAQQFPKTFRFTVPSFSVSNGRRTSWYWLWRQSGVLASQVTLAIWESIRLKQTKNLLTQLWEPATRHWMKASPYYLLQHTFIVGYSS